MTLPNGLMILAHETKPIAVETIILSSMANWYFKCPGSIDISNENETSITNSTPESSFDKNTTDFTFNPEPTPEPSQFNETNSIVGHFWVQSKAKINNLIGFFNVTLS